MRLTVANTGNHFYILRTLHTNRSKTMLHDTMRVVYMPHAWPVKKVVAAFGVATASYQYHGSLRPIDRPLYNVHVMSPQTHGWEEFPMDSAKLMLQLAVSRFIREADGVREFLDTTRRFEKRIYAKTISLEPVAI